MSEKDEIEIDLVDLIKYCWKRKWFFFLWMAIGAVILVGFCIVSIKMPPEKSPLPNKYTSTVKLFVRESSKSSISSTISSLASLGGININSGVGISNGMLMTTIANTNSYKDAIIGKFNLIKSNKVKRGTQSSARKALSNSLSIKLDDKTSVLSISFTDIDPEFAYEVSSYATELLIEKFYEFSADDDAISLKNYKEAMDDSFKKIVQYQTDIQNLEQSVSNTSAASVPSIMFDVQMKKMELEAEETIYASFRGQHELLTIQMNDDPTTIKLLQAAEIPDMKSAPSRAKFCIIAEMVVFFLCFIKVFFSYYRQISKKEDAVVKEEVK